MSLMVIASKNCNYLPQITPGRSCSYVISFTLLNKLTAHVPAAEMFPKQVDAGNVLHILFLYHETSFSSFQKKKNFSF